MVSPCFAFSTFSPLRTHASHFQILQISAMILPEQGIKLGSQSPCFKYNIRAMILQCCCASLLSHVQLVVTSWTATCQAPLSMGIFQARILEWVAMPSSRESSQSRDQTQVSHYAGRFFTEPPGKTKYTGVGSLSLLQGIFLTQESNRDLLHCRQVLYQLSYRGSPWYYSKSPIYERVPFQDCIHKLNLFINPTKLA